MDAKSPQSCPTLCNPTDCRSPGSSVHGESPGKNTGVGCHFFLQAIFPTREPNLHLTGRRALYHQHHLGSPGSPEHSRCHHPTLKLESPHSVAATLGTPSGGSSWYVERPLLSEVQKAEASATTPPTPPLHCMGPFLKGWGGALIFDIHHLF